MTNGICRVETDLKQHGLLHLVEDIALRSINQVMCLKVLHCMKLDAVNPEFLAPPEGYRGLVLDQAQLARYAKAPEYELSQAFVDQACAKEDQCYGLFDGDVLGAYQWYSTKPTDSTWCGIVVNFSNQYVYMYKAFTHPDHRGKRLYPIGVTTMLATYTVRGYKGILSLVESNNFASLKSCYRMGYTDCGKVYAAVLLDHYLLHADSTCGAYGFRLTPPASIKRGSRSTVRRAA